MNLALKQPKDRRGMRSIWSSCKPFVENSRAVLIHRPMRVSTYKCGNRPVHLGVHYWCGNGSTGTKNFAFLDEVPRERLLCARCEAAAVAAGLPSASSLCGRHVHEGVSVVIQTCCEEIKS